MNRVKILSTEDDYVEIPTFYTHKNFIFFPSNCEIK